MTDTPNSKYPWDRPWPFFLSSQLDNADHLERMRVGGIIPNRRPAPVREIEQKNDPVNTYTVNSMEERGPEHIMNPDIITLGCSQTWGVGVPDGTLWPDVLAKQTGMSHVNLASPGEAIQQNLDSLIRYIKVYGKPKYVVALFSDFTRNYMLLNTERMRRDEEPASQDDPGVSFTPVFHDRLNRQYSTELDIRGPKYAKKPFLVTDVVSKETFLFYYMQYLSMIQAYCEASGIKLLFSTWDASTMKVLNRYTTNGVKLSGFCYFNKTRWISGSSTEYHSNCHSDEEETYGRNWIVGADATDDIGGHIGIHEHLDIAEMFANEIKNVRID
jgi:hypothetical protein